VISSSACLPQDCNHPATTDKANSDDDKYVDANDGLRLSGLGTTRWRSGLEYCSGNYLTLPEKKNSSFSPFLSYIPIV
jgi:hypothetical protein